MDNKKSQYEQVVRVKNLIIFLLFLTFSFCAYPEIEKILNIIRSTQNTLEASILLIVSQSKLSTPELTRGFMS